MEIIKKNVERLLIVEHSGNTFTFKPDLNAFYYFKLSLTSEVKDIGFFDAYEPESETPIYPFGQNNAQPIGLENLL